MTKANLGPLDETTILGGRVRLVQPSVGALRAGLDAVMAAAACPAKPGQHVLDLGCGAGGAGFCVMARVPGVEITGLDIQPTMVECARESARLNNWHNGCLFIEGNLTQKDLLPADAFDHAVCNPPYMQAGQWYETPAPMRARAMGKRAGDALLADWIDCLQRTVKPGGSVSLVHRADHLDKIIQALGTRFGGIEIWPLHPHAGEDATRIVIRALKNRKSPSVIHPGLVLHEGDAWTEQADAILRDAKPLP